MTWVKVCGMTNAEDVAVAVAAGTDAIGFVNVPSSPRYVELEAAVELAATATGVVPVLLTLDREPQEVLEILRVTEISGVQPYGKHREETARRAAAAGYVVLYPTHPQPGLDYGSIPGHPLVDTPSATKLGGTGRVFDWSLVSGITADYVLAGGLNPQNVGEAIVRTRPWGVDASSGLERSPGRKDHGMVADFIKKAKAS